MALLESEYVTDEIIDKLIGALQETIKTVKTNEEKDTFKKGLELIKKIRSKEDQEMKMTEEELDKILDII